MLEPFLLVTTEEGGLDRYSQELAKRLPVRRKETRRYLNFSDRFNLIRLLSSLNALVHLPNQHFGRFAFFLKAPFLITVHDIARFKFHFVREGLAEKLGLWLDRKGIKKADLVIAVSEYTKRDIVEFLGVPPEKIEVIYNGIDLEVFKPRKDIPFDFPYIMCVGSERPRKNLGRLLKAFTLIKKYFPGLKLVKVGTEGRSSDFRTRTLNQIAELGLEEDVIFVGHVEDKELSRYYSGALLLAYPSLYEGFGFPPLEAMACGCPVVASNTTSIPEIVGDAGVLFDPYEVDEIAEALRKVIEDEKLRKRIIEKGLNRVKRFSWDKTADQTYNLYQKVINKIMKESSGLLCPSS